MLAGSNEPPPPGWIVSIAQELWRCYLSGKRVIQVTLDPKSPFFADVGRKVPVDIQTNSVVNSDNS